MTGLAFVLLLLLLMIGSVASAAWVPYVIDIPGVSLKQKDDQTLTVTIQADTVIALAEMARLSFIIARQLDWSRVINFAALIYASQGSDFSKETLGGTVLMTPEEMLKMAKSTMRSISMFIAPEKGETDE